MNWVAIARLSRWARCVWFLEESQGFFLPFLRLSYLYAESEFDFGSVPVEAPETGAMSPWLGPLATAT